MTGQAGFPAMADMRDQVQPFARVIIDQHHEAGRKVVLATTSPYDLVQPLAESVGLDDVIASNESATASSLPSIGISIPARRVG